MLFEFSVNTATREASGVPLCPVLFWYLLESTIVCSATLSHLKTQDPFPSRLEGVVSIPARI